MKKRTITLMLSVLAVMLLVGVGFATWVISQGAEATRSGNIIVEAVSDDRLDMTITPAEGSVPNIVFGHPATMNTTGAWLTSNGDASEQAVLEVAFTVELRKHGGEAFSSTAVPAVTAALSGDYTVDGQLIAFDGTTGTNNAFTISEVTLSDNDKLATYVVTLKFTWGELLGGLNPYDFFNAKNINHKLGGQISDPADPSDYAAYYNATQIAAINTTLGLSGQDVLTAESNFGDFAFELLDYLHTLNDSRSFVVTISASLA